MVQPRVVLVTGCTEGGLGHCICKAFARSGCKVYATGRCKDAIKLAQFGCEELELDVTDAAGISRAVQQVVQECGSIDVGERHAARSAGALMLVRGTQPGALRRQRNAVARVCVLSRTACTGVVLQAALLQTYSVHTWMIHHGVVHCGSNRWCTCCRQ
jgi:NAD(P)-dependent dehydrogenase (short-subunit alcohol dehydrogenase family)